MALLYLKFKKLKITAKALDIGARICYTAAMLTFIELDTKPALLRMRREQWNAFKLMMYLLTGDIPTQQYEVVPIERTQDKSLLAATYVERKHEND